MRTIKKKGIASEVQMAILAVIAIVILAVFLGKSYISLREKMDLQGCKNSIQAHDFIAASTGREVFTDIKCPTAEINIDNLKTTNRLIAEDMHRCWYIWGQGDGEFFEGDGSFCHICSIYQFDDKGKEVNGLMHYLYTQPLNVKYPGDRPGITFADYLMGSETPMARELIGRNIDSLADHDTIDTSQLYATIFVYTSDKKEMQKIMEDGGRSTTGTVGLFGVLGGGAAVGAGIFIASNPVGWIIGGVGAVATGAVLVWQSFTVEDPESVQFVVFRPYNADELDRLQCQKIDVNQMSNG